MKLVAVAVEVKTILTVSVDDQVLEDGSGNELQERISQALNGMLDDGSLFAMGHDREAVAFRVIGRDEARHLIDDENWHTYSGITMV